jgi:hypothetical protein
VGGLTGGLVTRAGYYQHVVLLALLPFMNPELYPGFVMGPGCRGQQGRRVPC